jgi:hypothetical protein
MFIGRCGFPGDAMSGFLCFSRFGGDLFLALTAAFAGLVIRCHASGMTESVN